MTFDAQVMATVLACGCLAAAARGTAVAIHGLVDRVPSTIEVVVPHGNKPKPSLPGVRVRRSRTLTPDQLVVVEGVPVTTVERAIVDLAITRSVARLRELVAAGLRAGLVTLVSMSEQLERAGRIHGARRMATALLDLDPDVAAAESAAEQAAFEALIAAGLPRPVRQHPVRLAGRQFRLDLAYPTLGLAIEIDGYWWHSTPLRKAADEARQNELVLAGWTVLRFGAGTVLRNPAAFAARVGAALASLAAA